ncbi:hypothetical protein JCM33374_g365 [Metschnikowia sp. JCM 33374]|nr:hypothetical protein JCM33374_g365 [Metschnikowia sp. JCM 33374]
MRLLVCFYLTTLVSWTSASILRCPPRINDKEQPTQVSPSRRCFTDKGANRSEAQEIPPKGQSVVKPPQIVKIQMDQCVLSMKRFVAGASFDVAGFEQSTQQIRNKLFAISDLMERMGPLGEELSGQLKYAKRLFRTMEDCAELLKFYTKDHSFAMGLIHDVVQANLRLLYFFDVNGVPKPGTKQIISRISKIVDQLRDREERFYSLSGLGLSVVVSFKFMFSKAEDSLNILASHGLAPSW